VGAGEEPENAAGRFVDPAAKAAGARGQGAFYRSERPRDAEDCGAEENDGEVIPAQSEACALLPCFFPTLSTSPPGPLAAHLRQAVHVDSPPPPPLLPLPVFLWRDRV